MQRACAAAIGAIALIGLPGCGGDSQEADLEAASQGLEDARSQVAGARDRVEQHHNRVTEAEGELDLARVGLREAEERLAEAERHVDLRATDAVLFRAVQRQLLEDRQLADVAIQARVERGVVTLAGRVPSSQHQQRAREIARGTPGVSRVEDRIEVAVSAAPEPAP